MRRLLSVLGLGAIALASAAFLPGPVDAADGEGESDIIICARFRDWTVPGTGITIEKPGDRFCVEVTPPVDDESDA